MKVNFHKYPAKTAETLSTREADTSGALPSRELVLWSRDYIAK